MRKKQYLALMLTIGLCGCDRVDTVKPKYEEKSQLPINANSVLVRYDINPDAKSDTTDSLFSKKLVKGVEKWATTRLRPSNQYGTAQLVVRNASIAKLPNPNMPEKMDGTLEVVISFYSLTGALLSTAEAKVIRSMPINYNLTADELERLKENLITKLVDALDVELEATLLRMANVGHYNGRKIR